MSLESADSVGNWEDGVNGGLDGCYDISEDEEEIEG